MDFEPRVSACFKCFAGAWTAGDSVCVPLQSGFCAVAETSGTEFSDIDLSQKVRRKPSYMALCRLVTGLLLYHGRSGLTTMKMANNQSVFWKWNTSLLECDNTCCCTFICIHTRNLLLKKQMCR